jgi:hypothetical protein
VAAPLRYLCTMVAVGTAGLPKQPLWLWPPVWMLVAAAVVGLPACLDTLPRARPSNREPHAPSCSRALARTSSTPLGL